VRYLVCLAFCASCATSPEAPLSTASFSANPAAHSARAQSGFVSYGAAYHKWTITFATIEGCTGDTVASVELDTLSGVTTIPVGATTLRPVQTTIATVPSAYLEYMASPLVSGTVTIDSAAEGFVTGSVTSQLMVGGVATEITGTFSAPTCL